MAKKVTACRWLYALCLAIFAFCFGWKIQSGQWLQTDLAALLPQQQHWNALQQAADQQQQQQLNRQFVALVGHSDRQTAFATAQQISQQWQRSGLFQHIDSQTQPDLAQLQQQIQQISLATLPANIRQQLLNTPQTYFQQYAQQLVDPFAPPNLLPLEQDWFGFGRFTLTQSALLPQIQWDSQTGMVYLEQPQRTWVLLRGVLATHSAAALLSLTEQNQQLSQQSQAELLLASAALFAAHAQQSAEQESSLMSALGISLTLLLLFNLFRNWRVLWLFLPIALGMFAGVAATVLLLGQIHILTIVIGTSLIGVLIDFPLHWLSGSLFNPHWQPQCAMKRLQFSFLISLVVTLLGYALLGFTALPVLQQTALFSGVALLAAIGATLLYLPPLFTRYQPRKRSHFCQNLQIRLGRTASRLIAAILLLATAFGLYKSQWQDDIRQWVAMPPALVQQLQQIGELTGIDFGSQYFLLTAENDQALLEKSQKISEKLTALQGQGKLQKFQSLNQWLMTEREQQQFAAQLSDRLRTADYQWLNEIGLPLEPFEQAQKNLKNRPLVSLSSALQTQLGQAWQSLYLGEIQPQQVAAMVKVIGVRDVDAVQALANQQDIFWQDKRSALNQSFQQTRDQAAWLKLLSFVLAGALLWRLFGLKTSAKMLLVPLLAACGVVAIFAYLNIAIGLFTMFGLLLVSAISIDYTAYMHTAPEPLADKRIAVSLAALTTVISFALLSFSSTPAVATFGLSVSLGVVLSLLFTMKIFRAELPENSKLNKEL